MNLQILLQCSDAAAGPKPIALTSDPSLVQQLIQGLYLNYFLEDDEHDRIFDPAFVRSASALNADLTREIRREAGRGFPEEDTGDSLALPDC